MRTLPNNGRHVALLAAASYINFPLDVRRVGSGLAIHAAATDVPVLLSRQTSLQRTHGTPMMAGLNLLK
jgi:hypothetical protein